MPEGKFILSIYDKTFARQTWPMLQKRQSVSKLWMSLSCINDISIVVSGCHHLVLVCNEDTLIFKYWFPCFNHIRETSISTSMYCVTSGYFSGSSTWSDRLPTPASSSIPRQRSSGEHSYETIYHAPTLIPAGLKISP